VLRINALTNTTRILANASQAGSIFGTVLTLYNMVNEDQGTIKKETK